MDSKIKLLDRYLTVDGYLIRKRRRESDSKIAREFQVGICTLHDWKTKAGLIGVNVYALLDERLTVEEYLARKRKKQTDSKIARDLRVSTEFLKKWKAKRGLKGYNVALLTDPLLTVEDYLSRKQNGETDKMIARDVKMNIKTLTNWKVKVGLTKYKINVHKVNGKRREKNLLDNLLTADDYIARKLSGDDDIKIANDLHVSLHTLERWKTKVEVKREDVNRKRYELMTNMLEKGMDMKEIAKNLGIDVRRCYYIRKQFSNKAS